MHLEARLAVIRSFLPEQRKVASAHLRGYATLPGITPDERTLLGLLAQMGRYEVWPAEEVAATARRALAGGAYFDDATGSIDAMVAWLVALVALIAADGFDDARREIDRAKQRVRLHGSPVEFAMVCNPAIIMHWQLGNLAFVEAEAEGVLAAVSEEDPVAQVIALRATATHFGAYCALERGDVDGAATLLARFDAEHSDVPRMLPTIWLHEPRASVALARGNPELARAEAFEQRDQLHAIGVDPPTMSWRSPAVQALLLLGEQREARTLAGELVAVARKWNTPTDVGPALRVLAHAEPDGRLALLTEAVAVLETSRARLHLARALVDLGEALRVAGRRSEARDPLHRGIDLATECGSIALRTRAVAALESLGDRPRKLMFAGVQALTASERRVADLALTGRANREIAHELFVTPKTVENHLGRIYTKLGINGRRELARALS
ncbi:helix-turn-helix transcriptional regulator [Actinophytocola algeriensis]